MREVVIPQTNKIMVEGEHVLIYAELLVWIGLWFMMETIQGFQRCDFWNNSTINLFYTSPYCFNNIITLARFK